ncbi:MAG: DUF1365 domain-containing protein [Alphaproteobacteria bacterium]|nr:DUF1365 domain-containing protein [Alphaproteobacteria bacterium]
MHGAALYPGIVTHRRLWRVGHRLRYRVLSLLVDVDHLPALDRDLPGFGYNRTALLGLYDRDHGPRDGTPLGTWVRRAVTEAGLPCPDQIELLCFPRILGQVFNPLSIHVCRHQGRLIAVVYEVRNTFGDLHCYLVPIPEETAVLGHACAKAFYVSPFLPLDGQYRFRLSTPAERYSLSIRHERADGTALVASHTATRMALTAASLRRAVLSHPLHAAKVLGGIHWEALRLWLKGAPFHHRPPAPGALITVVTP